MKEFERKDFNKSIESLALFWCPLVHDFCKTFKCSWCVGIYWKDREGNEQKGITCPVFQELRDFIKRVTNQWEGGNYYKIAHVIDADSYRAHKEVD